MNFDTFNRHMVGMQGGKLVILNPPKGPIEIPDALVFSAWIVALGDPSGEHFEKALSEVTSS